MDCVVFFNPVVANPFVVLRELSPLVYESLVPLWAPNLISIFDFKVLIVVSWSTSKLLLPCSKVRTKMLKAVGPAC